MFHCIFAIEYSEGVFSPLRNTVKILFFGNETHFVFNWGDFIKSPDNLN